ncbi:hypothetical protein GCM10027039_21550 [Terrabacter koreensis]
MADRDLDAEFERIIAGWDDEAPDPQRREAAPSPTDATAAEAPADEPSDTASDGADPTGSAVALDPSPAEAPPSASPDTTTPAGGRLELPIAPTTSHAWRGSTPRRDDADDLLDASDGDDDHFVPPSEIDLPSAETDPMFWAIVGGLVGGPLLLLYVLFFDRDGSGWWVATALAMVVVGFVLLVLRGGNERDPFDDGTRV